MCTGVVDPCSLSLHAMQPAPPVLSFERFDLFPYNNGVMLWNMPFMKKTNADFIDWILSQHNGLHYGSEHCLACGPQQRVAGSSARSARGLLRWARGCEGVGVNSTLQAAPQRPALC